MRDIIFCFKKQSRQFGVQESFILDSLKAGKYAMLQEIVAYQESTDINVHNKFIQRHHVVVVVLVNGTMAIKLCCNLQTLQTNIKCFPTIYALPTILLKNKNNLWKITLDEHMKCFIACKYNSYFHYENQNPVLVGG